MSELSLTVTPPPKLPTFEINAAGNLQIESAMAGSALIARVTGHDSKEIAVRAQQELKAVITRLEKVRVIYKEPLLVAGRQVDSHISAKKLPLEKEFGRVSGIVAEFDNTERDRVREEQRLQRVELERIEAAKQAELKRIADAQAEAERKIQAERDRVAKSEREQKEAAEKLAREATNKKQRETAAAALKLAEENAESNRKEEERLRAEASTIAATQTAAVEEKAGDAAYAAGRPVEITKIAGQRTTADWEITKINEWTLAKARPDLVRKIEFDLRAMKDELKRGVKLPGVEAHESYTAGVRVPPQRTAIEV